MIQESDDIRSTREHLKQRADEMSRALALGSRSHENTQMDHVPRPELDAKLATIEAKMDGRLSRIEDALRDIKAQGAEQKSTAWKAAAATMGVIVGVVALAVGSFDSGRETEKLISEARRDLQTAVQQTEQKQVALQQQLSEATKQQVAVQETVAKAVRALESSNWWTHKDSPGFQPYTLPPKQ
ncbi:hypothetical protein LP085_08615 [Achromobacter sp. MY14]|uniref:hypothetical protein n=1 Tax=unclassified Achromobacter TaxID=2626865 RepID=UPI001E4B8E0E|nr:hypothetical protein [Achromobacter sp. MY14]MCD0496906.1 hypothetical protein [Achromobacter sp. MY14]